MFHKAIKLCLFPRFTRKLLKVGRSAGRREHGEETSVMPMVKVLVGRYLKQICMMNKI